jgi:hypothetical protein
MPMKKANENAKNAQPMQQQMQQANALIGRNEKLLASDGTTPQGVVTSIQVLSGVPKFLVNGSLYDLNQMLSISASSSNC